MKKTVKKILLVCAIVLLSVLLFSPTLFQGGNEENRNQSDTETADAPERQAEAEETAVRKTEPAFSDREPSMEKAEGPLEIYEIVASNTGMGARPDGEFTDWIEIKIFLLKPSSCLIIFFLTRTRAGLSGSCRL